MCVHQTLCRTHTNILHRLVLPVFQLLLKASSQTRRQSISLNACVCFWFVVSSVRCPREPSLHLIKCLLLFLWPLLLDLVICQLPQRLCGLTKIGDEPRKLHTSALALAPWLWPCHPSHAGPCQAWYGPWSRNRMSGRFLSASSRAQYFLIRHIYYVIIQ